MTLIPELLRKSRVIAVVGLSSKRTRPSFGVAEYMKQQGYRIIPVNPNESEVLGEKCYARLEDIPEHVDIVDIFRRSELVAPVVESAIRIGASAVWMRRAARLLVNVLGVLIILDAFVLFHACVRGTA